ncbi:unnamed protein product [Ceratitis capitata]|uniref:(Mediterranean fruit fly) hypothetical protein n=1 Tax=Ceratitis capitata TaxID=7213 RepID=A0A811U419_CERCA|nr:unnamed protein product [Ceratitis capitata]
MRNNPTSTRTIILLQRRYACASVCRKFDVEKLQSQQTAERFSTRLEFLLSESTLQQLGIRELWDGISSTLRTAANETIGFRKGRKNSWYNEDCRVAVERK